MTEKPLVSVIINCYNGEKYLREAIDSVIAQTYENWELVFWDNQSTDSTREIVESYKNPKIKYFYAPVHTSLGEARNGAMERASGDYFGFLDTDDRWLPSFLSDYVSAINDNHDTVIVYSNYYSQEGEKKWLAYPPRKSGILETAVFVKNYNIAISAALFKAEIVKNENIKFNTAFSLIEDYDFFVKLCLFGTICYISEPLMVYLYHENNLSHSTKWVDEFHLLLKLLNNGEGIYHKVAKFNKIISERSDYTEANYYIFSNQRKKAFPIIFKNILRNTGFFVLLFKILIGPRFLNRIHRWKQKV